MLVERGMLVKTVWVAGGSGLVGGELVQLLLGDGAFERVIAAGRRPLPLQHEKLRSATVDFADPASFEALDAPDAAFCCLGTTIKKAGSPEAFRGVDHGAVLGFAKAALARGARVFLHVTALGADAGSRALYNRVKGEVEEAVAELGFESVYTFRPSILDGEREESRPLERVGLAVGRALAPLLGKYRPTRARAVAEAMVASCQKREPGVHVIDRFAR
jgi:uncharacterized protein YbjT (DUF2867 family)